VVARTAIETTGHASIGPTHLRNITGGPIEYTDLDDAIRAAGVGQAGNDTSRALH
jgi:hypothetical protein